MIKRLLSELPSFGKVDSRLALAARERLLLNRFFAALPETVRLQTLFLIAAMMALPLFAAPSVAVFRNATGAGDIFFVPFGSTLAYSGGGLYTGDAAAAQMEDGTTFVVVQDRFGALYVNTIDTNQDAWGTWKFIGGLIEGSPAIVIPPEGNPRIFIRDQFRAYWMVTFDLATRNATWTGLGGVFDSDPSAATSADGSTFVVGRDIWGGVWSGRIPPPGQGANMQVSFCGGIIQGKPAIAVGTDGFAYIAARDPSGGMWMARANASSCGNWLAGGGVFASDPQIVSARGTLHVAGLDAGGGVWHNAAAEGASNRWKSWLGPLGTLSDVSLASRDAQAFLVGRTPNGEIYWRDIAASQWLASGSASIAVTPPKAASQIGRPRLLSVVPAVISQTFMATLTVTGQFTNFTQGATQVDLGPDVSVGQVNVTSPTVLTAQVTASASAAIGPRSVQITSFGEVVTFPNAVTIDPSAPPSISDFNPKSGPPGALVTVSGTNLTGANQVSLAKQGGGLIQVPPANSNGTSLSFTIPPGVATGVFTIGSATSPAPLTITLSSDFDLTADPPAVSLMQGQSASFAVRLASSSGLTQLANLSLGGLPAGIQAAFKPPAITAGQTAVLTLTAPVSQPAATAALSVSATARIDGLPVTRNAAAQVTVQTPTTSFLGRTVVDDPLQTPLAGVTIRMLGVNGSGGATGCTGSAVSDAAGNFLLRNLPASCTGRQLIGFDGLTATSPPGLYAGVNLVYTLTAGQVTASPVLIHLPRIDNKEVFSVQQNSSVDQTYSFASIPGLSVTVYRNTTFTMPDGQRPNPFRLVAAQVPVDRLPDYKPPVPTMVSVFIVAFQPANAVASQPVAVYYPNTLNTAPGVNMTMMTLDPTRGQMVPYGTGTVSADGVQVVPDFDPAFPGRRYGIVNFDWHGPMPPGSPVNPGFCPIPKGTNPVDLTSGLEVLNETDIAISGLRGNLSIQRVYRTLSNEAGPFGIGASHNYGYRLDTNTPQSAAIINLVFPDGKRAPFARGVTATLTNSTILGLLGVRITVLPDGKADLRWKDGTLWRFVPASFPLGSLLESITDPNGNVTALRRDSTRPRRITEITHPVGRKLSLQYDSSDRITSITDPIGRIVQYTYNTQSTLASVTDPEGGVTRYAYDAQNRLTQVTDARGVVMAQNNYDANGRVARQVVADGGAYQFAYTLANPLIPTSPVLATRVTDPMGHVETYRFNPQGFLVDATDAVGQTRILERQAGTNLLLSVRGSGSCNVCGASGSGDLSFTYDGAGNVLTRTDALGATTRFTYEATFNRVTSITDALGHATTFAHDARGNLTSLRNARGAVTSFIYNPAGLVMEVTDPLNHKTTISYDAYANPVQIRDSLGNITGLNYDAASRVTEAIDALGRQSSATYDRLDRITSARDGGGFVTRFAWDAVDNMLSLTDARNNTTSFTYDPMRRLLTKRTPAGRVDTRQYDHDGNLTHFTDRRGQLSTFAYDELHRLVRETYQDSTVDRQYDPSGRLLNVIDTLGGTFTFTYDLVGRLLTSAGPTGGVLYVRDALGRVTSRQVIGHAAVTHTYDPVGNLLTAASPQAAVAFTHDLRDQIAGQTRSNNVSTTYSRDALGRVLSIIHVRGATALNTQTYTYDAVGNRTSYITDIAQPLITQTASSVVDNENRLLQRGNVTYAYDANGNRAAESGPFNSMTYTWDSRNRLVTVEANGASTSLKYDFTKMMIRQDSTAGASHSFVLDDITNVALESTGIGEQVTMLTGRDLDEHYASIQNSGQAEFRFTDTVTSTVLTADTNGVLTAQFYYEPYGQTTGTREYAFQFNGRQRISSDLYYYRFRFYDSSSGTFLSEDPLSDFSGLSLYSYAGNGPVVWTDPTGLRVDMNRFNPTDPLWPSAENVPSSRRRYLVGGHGGYGRVGWLDVAPDVLADLIMQDPAFRGGDVQLMSCNSGIGNKGILSNGKYRPTYAQLLADALGVDVIAGDALVWYAPDGRTLVAPKVPGSPSAPDLSRPGHWVRYRPRIRR